MSEVTGDFASDAERELDAHLEVVRREPPAPPPSLSGDIVRTLRWQAVVVLPITAGLSLAQGLLSGVRLIARGGDGS